MKNLIVTSAQREDLKVAEMTVYTGRIRVNNNNGDYLYSHSTGITRTTKEDAILDAEKLKSEMLYI